MTTNEAILLAMALGVEALALLAGFAMIYYSARS